MAGSGIMASNNQGAGAKPSYQQQYGNYDTKGNQGGMAVGHLGGKQQDMYGTQNKRGSEFKKSA